MIDFKDAEKDILDFWDENKIFQKSIDKPAPQGDYLFYDGPPFATGLPHYGHFPSSFMKDAVPRFWTMKGYSVERRWGWDCHGLPIENLIEKELGFKSKKDIEAYGIDKFNEACRAKVLFYAEEWQKTIRRVGRWVDMENDYKTMDLSFMESVWWVFKELWDKDLIYEDYRSMHICPRCETTLSQSEVAEGYRDIKDLSVTAKFELVDEPRTYVLVWTTTPWTLIGNVALAVGADIDYVKIVRGEEKFIIAKELWENYAKELGDNPEIVAEMKGSDLVSKRYKALVPYYAENKELDNRDNGWQIYDADFVTTDEGTGIVHMAPAFGEDDMKLGKDKNMPWVQHVAMDGTIAAEVLDFAGLNVKPKDNHQDTDIKIIKYLAHKELLFAKEKYEHSYPHCWRCDTPLLNYATSSWFVAVSKIKDKILKQADKINWSPAHIKAGRFGKWLEGARDWSISRQRFWASVIPLWQCDKCDHSDVYGSVAVLAEVSGQEIKDIHKHVVDKITYACRKCEGGTMTRIPDVLDTWFDSGSMPYAQQHYPFENRDKFDNNFPAHFVAEGADQTRAWFYYLHLIATAIKGKPAYENAMVNGIVLAEDGKKMSKKLQNYPDTSTMIEKYGADALRIYIMSSPVVQAENLSFSEKDLQITYRRFVVLLQNVFNFYKMFRGDKPLVANKLPKLNNDLDKWIIAKLNILIDEVGQSMEAYNLLKATRPLVEFIDLLSTWYVRRSRDRFKGDDANDKAQAIATLGYSLNQLAKVIAPFAPMTAETIWQGFANDIESVHLAQWPDVDKRAIDNDILEKMDTVRAITERAHALRAKSAMKVRQPLATLEVASKLDDDYRELLQEELNVETVKSVEKISAGDNWKIDEEGIAIALDIELTDDLKDKGAVRELIRFMNSLRKEAGLKPQDSPVETYKTDSQYLQAIISKFTEEIISATSAGELVAVNDNPDTNKEVMINEEKITLGLKF